LSELLVPELPQHWREWVLAQQGGNTPNES
jgi:hypothetical protein